MPTSDATPESTTQHSADPSIEPSAPPRTDPGAETPPEPFPRADEENLRRDEAASRSAELSVTDYEVEVDLSDAAAEGALSYPVTTRIFFHSRQPGGSTFLDYLGESVEHLQLNGRSLDIASHVGAARILLPDLEAENTVEIHSTSRFSRSGEGMHRFVDPSDGQVYLYTQYEPADSRRVFPVFEQPDLKARFRFCLIGPAQWQLRSNGAEISREPVEGTAAGSEAELVRVRFAETAPMSSYITALLAGPYHLVQSSWAGAQTSEGMTGPVALTVLCRESMAEHFDAEEILDLTRAGLDFFHAEFDYPYPWGKYDQVFVPEYNLGAMENPGLVTFTEAYVFDTAATDAQRETRANTLMHEMAHMWFGDLVTMHWWDDLWLKESFADYMGSLAVDEATGWETSWISFANARKAWAYVQDQLPTTHPIVADITDLEAADQNFDGITYAKGASVLKQLAAFVGREAFRESARRYFRRHAFANASLGDFLDVLEEVSGRDMRAWSRAWLQTAGVPVLTADTVGPGDGHPGDQPEGPQVVITQHGVDPATGEVVNRPHVVEVGVHVLDEQTGALHRHDAVRLRLTAEAAQGRTTVDGLSLPAENVTRLLLPNEQDLTYAKLSLDVGSVAAVLRHPIADPLARATVWAAVWSMVRDGELPARTFVEAVMTLGLQIEEVVVVQSLLRQADTAVARFAAPQERGELTDRLAARLAAFLTEVDGGDAQRAAARVLASLSRRTDSRLDLLGVLLDGDAAASGISGLEVDDELRWAFLQALAAHGRLGADQLDAQLRRRTTARTRIAHRLALAARPEPRVKREAFAQAISGVDAEGEELSNDHLTAVVEGFRCGTGELTAGYDEDYFAALRPVWSQMSQGQATRVIDGLFPMEQKLPTGTAPEDHPMARRTARWLTENPDAPAALRRLLIESEDALLRSLRAQQAAQS
ncbi:aminopeptidase N [Nesterenkonia aerolata]|uniref:Aminopeptidase N n=1 Tax=Nesterenkonia aerolata TaxID=3074079 RepID=A0ABU2DQ48_9MICC|nr:aminopeptidase N [Nesterenkonia sp. LY-0111]MDR8018633.1 aminopeptidase N [Nesterenkonia sp. LY-0111]